MPEGGRITIETANKWLDDRAAMGRDLPPGQYLSLCVTDTGTGMTPDVVAKAFDSVSSPRRPAGPGDGAGPLDDLRLRPAVGGRSASTRRSAKAPRCVSTAPVTTAEAEGDAAMPDLADAPAAPEQGETVLIVDDEPTVRMLVTEVMEDLGYNRH